MRRWGPAAVALALLAGTAIAFATTERQKLEKTPFAVLRLDDVLSPVCRCPTGHATIVLRFRRTHVLTVQILGPKGGPLRTLTKQATVHAGTVDLRWRGRDDAGRTVPDGEYVPRFVLDDGRTFDPPNPIRVDGTPPRVTTVSYSAGFLRRRAPKGRIRISYVLSEAAHPLLYVTGRRTLRGGGKALTVRGGGKALTGKFDWTGRQGGRRLPPGRYWLQLAAVDLAGNVGPETPRFLIRIR